MMVVISVAAAIAVRVQFTLTNTAQREKRAQAEGAANAGLQRALVELTQNPDWETTAPFTGTLTSNPRLSFQVEVVNNRLGTAPRTSVPGGPMVPPKRVWMRSQGLVDGEIISGGGGQAEAFTFRPEPIFNYVMRTGTDPTVAGNILLDGVTIDSFDGNPPVGTPPPYYVDYLSTHPPTLRTDAAIWSDRGSFNLTQGARVDADLASNTPTVQVTDDGTTNWYGQTVADVAEEAPLIFHKPRQFRSISPSTAPTTGPISPGCYGPLTGGGPITLSAGTYYFERLILSGDLELDSSVSATAPCVVYVGSMFILGDGVLVNMFGPGSPKPPRHLQIYCTEEETPPHSGTYFRFSANVEASCVIAGDSAYGNLAGTNDIQLYGAVYASDIQLLGTPNLGMHYDTSLKDTILAGLTEWVMVNESD